MNYVLCLDIVVIFMELVEAKSWGDILKSSFEMVSHRGSGQILSEISLYVILPFSNFIVSLSGYCKSLYWITLFSVLLLCYLFCIY